MEESIRSRENISADDKEYILFIFETGIREIYDITYHKSLTNLEDIRKMCSLAGKDYNGNHPNPPSLLASKTNTKCPVCHADFKELELKKMILERKDKELQQREKELDEAIKKYREK